MSAPTPWPIVLLNTLLFILLNTLSLILLAISLTYLAFFTFRRETKEQMVEACSKEIAEGAYSTLSDKMGECLFDYDKAVAGRFVFMLFSFVLIAVAIVLFFVGRLLKSSSAST